MHALHALKLYSRPCCSKSRARSQVVFDGTLPVECCRHAGCRHSWSAGTLAAFTWRHEEDPGDSSTRRSDRPSSPPPAEGLARLQRSLDGLARGALRRHARNSQRHPSRKPHLTPGARVHRAGNWDPRRLLDRIASAHCRRGRASPQKSPIESSCEESAAQLPGIGSVVQCPSESWARSAAARSCGCATEAPATSSST